MNMTNNVSWQRLERVIQWAGMTINHFGRHIGLARSEALYQIRAGQHGISQALARRIVEKFPEVSIGWLLSGEGDMLGRPMLEGAIPFYEGDISKGVGSLMQGKPQCMLNIPLMETCDLAFRSWDEAMSGDVMVGTIVFLKKTDVAAIIPGGLYVIVCANYVILRRVKIDDGEPEGLRLECSNPKYDNMTIKAEQVVEIYRVVGNLKQY